MTDQDAEQAAGVRLEKTDEYTRHRDAMKAHGFAVVHGFKADAMRDELLTALRGLQAEKMSLLAESMRREEDDADAIKRASARADYAEEIAQHNGWHLAYERAVREVVEAAYQHLKTEYLSSLIDDVHDRRLEQAEQALAEQKRLNVELATHSQHALRTDREDLAEMADIVRPLQDALAAAREEIDRMTARNAELTEQVESMKNCGNCDRDPQACDECDECTWDNSRWIPTADLRGRGR
jgi:hypothetical protein